MTKIQKTSQTMTPFAGVSFTNSEFNRCGLSQLIDKELGSRTFAGYRDFNARYLEPVSCAALSGVYERILFDFHQSKSIGDTFR